jgi:hypothetical protein
VRVDVSRLERASDVLLAEFSLVGRSLCFAAGCPEAVREGMGVDEETATTTTECVALPRMSKVES